MGDAVHELAVCAFAESDMTNRLVARELKSADNIDLLCVQLYMDRLGHGVNGAAVTRPRR